jgi:prepilin-type N-terminal cleavage/methylation domain-containing protein
MPYQSARRQRGFSLIELLIGMSLFLMVLFAIYQVFDSSRATYARGQRKVDVQQHARVAIDEMGRQIRMAGYFPENFATPPAAPLLTNPVQVATHNALAIYGDADGSGASNVFLYCLDGAVVRRGKAASGVVPAYTCSAGDNLAENITSLSFKYYDTNNTPIPNPQTPPYQLDAQGLGAVPDFTTTPQRAAVRTVVITLTAREDVPSQAAQFYTLTSTVRLRNLN